MKIALIHVLVAGVVERELLAVHLGRGVKYVHTKAVLYHFLLADRFGFCSVPLLPLQSLNLMGPG